MSKRADMTVQNGLLIIALKTISIHQLTRYSQQILLGEQT